MWDGYEDEDRERMDREAEDYDQQLLEDELDRDRTRAATSGEPDDRDVDYGIDGDVLPCGLGY